MHHTPQYRHSDLPSNSVGICIVAVRGNFAG
jgi:hypothetical protein